MPQRAHVHSGELGPVSAHHSRSRLPGRLLGIFVVALGLAMLLAASPSRAAGLGCEPAQPGWGAPRQDLAAQVLEQLNAYREGAGLSRLTTSPSLQRAALWKAGHMVFGSYYAHADLPDGRQPEQRAVDCGYPLPSIGENIHRGPDSVAAVMQSWKASPGHNANMLQPFWTNVGIGVVKAPGNGYFHWVQIFGDSISAQPPPPAFSTSPDALSSQQGGSGSFVDLIANDPDGSSSYARVTGIGSSSLGSFSIDSDARGVIFSPSSTRSGTQTVTYTATDFMGRSQTEQLRIVVEPTPSPTPPTPPEPPEPPTPTPPTPPEPPTPTPPTPPEPPTPAPTTPTQPSVPGAGPPRAPVVPLPTTPQGATGGPAPGMAVPTPSPAAAGANLKARAPALKITSLARRRGHRIELRFSGYVGAGARQRPLVIDLARGTRFQVLCRLPIRASGDVRGTCSVPRADVRDPRRLRLRARVAATRATLAATVYFSPR